MATQDALHQKQEDLTLVVEPLVDSISELVLAAVTQSYDNIQKCCLDISERTNKLVLIAQQVATASTDVDLQIEVANAINGIAAAIEKLVVGFTAILTNTNPKTQEDFAAAARDVGEAINKLVAATDQTSQRKIMVAVKEALESAKQVQESAFRGKDALLQAAQLNVDKTVRLVKAANLAAGATADEKKKNMFLDGANSIKGLSPKLIQVAKSVMENPQDQNHKNELDSVIREITSAFTLLLSAAKLSPSYFGKLNETFEYVKKLIEMARSLEEEVSNLYTAVQSGTQQQFLESAKLTASKAIALAEQAEAAMKLETDPVRRQIIKDAVAELREASSAMIKASKAYRENPTPENKAELDRCYQRLEASIKAVIAASGKEVDDSSPKGRLDMASTALENASKAVLRSAEKRSAEDLAADSEMLAAIALQYAKDAEAVANEISDPVKKKAILDNAQAIRELSQKIIAAAKRVLANPNDAQAKKELEELHTQLLQRITAVKRAANMIPGSDEDVNVNNLSFALDGKSPEAQLIQAATEGAHAALQLAAEAEKRVESITDPTKKKQFQEAIAHVKLCSKKVLAASEALAANPYDPVLQKNLAEAQKELDEAVHKVVQLSSQSIKDENELADAMAEMKISNDSKNLAASNNNAIKMAEEVMKDIAALFGDPNRKLKPEEVIAGAKQLSAKASELAKQLREMAEKTTDPVFKEKLLQSAKIIRDGSVQIKILSAVRAAGGEDKSNSVAMSAKGLDTNIKEILKLVNAEMLKNRFRATVKQTIAINKVVNVWKSKSKK